MGRGGGSASDPSSDAQHQLPLGPEPCACMFPLPLSIRSHLCSPGTWSPSILLSPISSRCLLPSEALIRSYSITLPFPPFPTRFLVHPLHRSLSALCSPRMVPHHPCSPRTTSSTFQAPPLTPSPGTCSTAVILSVQQALISPPHLCDVTAALSARPRQPGLAPCSHSPFRLFLFLWCRAQNGRQFLPKRLPAPLCSGQGPPCQRKLCLRSSGGCYLVTITCLFLCDLDMAGSHQPKSPNVMLLPMEAFQDAPVSLWLCRDQLLGWAGWLPWRIKLICKSSAYVNWTESFLRPPVLGCCSVPCKFYFSLGLLSLTLAVVLTSSSSPFTLPFPCTCNSLSWLFLSVGFSSWCILCQPLFLHAFLRGSH